jgi:hypothetical protein
MGVQAKCAYCGKVLRVSMGYSVDVSDLDRHGCFSPSQPPKFTYLPFEKYGEQG